MGKFLDQKAVMSRGKGSWKESGDKFKEDISKCLNNTSRMRASAFLTVSGLTSAWFCHLEVCLLPAIQSLGIFVGYRVCEENCFELCCVKNCMCSLLA